jgi:hypothetical protein
MDFPQFTSTDRHFDAIRERHRQVADDVKASSGASVFIRVSLWLGSAVMMAVMLLHALGEALAGLGGTPVPSSEYRPELTWATALFFLSLVPLFWPKAPRGLVALGVVWAVLGGLLVVAVW